jgi:hypothetical protein
MTPKGSQVTAPKPFYKTSQERDNLLPALRELLSLRREAVDAQAEVLADLLYERSFFSHRPEVFDVEAALEALRIEGEVLG